MNRREIHPPPVQPLCDCIAEGDLESARRLLDADSSLVNATFFRSGDDRPNRLLDVAVRHKECDILRLLLERGAYSNRAIYDAAHIAYSQMQVNDPEPLRILLEEGPPFDILGAAASGRTERVAELLESEPGCIGTRDEQGRSPLCVASWIIGWPDVVTLLLEAGADPSDPADPRYPDYPNEIALRQALGHYPEDGHADVARVLLNHGGVSVYYIPPVTLEVLKQDPAGLREVLSAGADPNEPDRWGQTPVEVAAQIRGGVGTELVRVLLDAGGQPSLHLVSGNIASAELCLQRGADVNEYDQLFYLAVAYGPHETKLDVVRFLLSQGIDVNRRRSGTALDGAIECEREDIADLLRSHGGLRAAELDSGAP